MTLGRHILRPVAWAAGRHAATQVRAFMRAHEQTRQFQDRLLAELVSRHADTAFGRDHGLAQVRTFEDFRSAVPVGDYEAFRPYVDRVLAGETSALIPPGEDLLMFSLTSGTTGEPKHIPVTSRFAAQMRRGWNIFGYGVLRDHPDAWLRQILQISSPMREKLSPRGLPCGAISGLLAASQKKIVRWMYVVPPTVPYIKDPAARYYTTLRCGVGRDVAIITTANPSSVIRLIETGQEHVQRLIRDVADGTLTPPGESEADLVSWMKFKPNPALARRMEEGIRRDGRLLPRHFWKVAFLANWTGGTLGLYLPRLRELFDDAPIRDIGLLASEGRFSLPIADGTAAGITDITSNFLEFIPAEERESSAPRTLRADEVDVGQEYFLVLSNWTGLMRYNIDDRVRVTAFHGQSPVIEFLHRGTRTASITGEKLTEHQVVEAMRRTCAAAGVKIDRFILQGRFAHTPFYELRMEAACGVAPSRVAELVDEALSELNIEYQSKRSSGRLGPVRAVVLPDGAMERAERQAIQARRGRIEQYKHQYLLTEVLTDVRVPVRA
ncbi:MAG: GH3 auxin-responsive promoter family protein [Phycisphaerae bacterium]